MNTLPLALLISLTSTAPTIVTPASPHSPVTEGGCILLDLKTKIRYATDESRHYELELLGRSTSSTTATIDVRLNDAVYNYSARRSRTDAVSLTLSRNGRILVSLQADRHGAVTVRDREGRRIREKFAQTRLGRDDAAAASILLSPEIVAFAFTEGDGSETEASPPLLCRVHWAVALVCVVGALAAWCAKYNDTEGFSWECRG